MDYPGRLIAITRILVIKERGRRIRIREGDVTRKQSKGEVFFFLEVT